jgi:hypothetical protein
MVALSLGLWAVPLNAGATPAETSQASAIATIVHKAMKTEHLRAVIVKVTQGDKIVTSQAFGKSITGAPATTAMHFRNGAVAFAYMGTLLMEFVDQHKVQARRHDRALDAGAAGGKQGHLKDVGEPDHGISGLRDRSEVARGL